MLWYAEDQAPARCHCSTDFESDAGIFNSVNLCWPEIGVLCEYYRTCATISMVCWVSEIDALPPSVTFLISTHSHRSLPQDVWTRSHVRRDRINAVRSLFWLLLSHRVNTCSSASAKFGSYIYVAVLGKDLLLLPEICRSRHLWDPDLRRYL